jgi:hypothetical protein
MSIRRAVTSARLRTRFLVLLATVVLAGAGGWLIAVGPASGRGAVQAGGPARGGGTSASLVLHQASALTLALSPDQQTITMNLLGNVWTLPRQAGGPTGTRAF